MAEDVFGRQSKAEIIGIFGDDSPCGFHGLEVGNNRIGYTPGERDGAATECINTALFRAGNVYMLSKGIEETGRLTLDGEIALEKTDIESDGVGV